jgi:hypothetical protein
LVGIASLLDVEPTCARLSSSAPVLFRTSSSSWTLSLNTIRFTSRSCRTSAVRAKSAVLAIMSSSTAPMRPQASVPPLRKKLRRPTSGSDV